MFCTAAATVMRSTALALGLGVRLSVAAAEVSHDETPERRGTVEPSILDRTTSAVNRLHLAQFVIPKKPEKGQAAGTQLPSRLTYQYGYGSESDVVYRRNADLDNRVRDDILLLKPQLSGYITYRPTDWLEATLEMVFEREIPALEEETVLLPNGETQVAVKRQFSLLVDQAFLTFKAFSSGLQFTVGRRNYEDDRHWLYDTSMDIASIALKLWKFRVEALAGREILVGLDLLKDQTSLETRTTTAPDREADRVNTYMLLAEYRGIEDMKLTAFAIFRDDRARQEGRPLLLGAHAHGMPSDELGYWIELGHVRGSDEVGRTLSAYGFDVGATYRFTGLSLTPGVTVAYAFGTGDGDPAGARSHEFRQTGLQSNEVKFAGLAKFKGYGEVIDPELSNLKILTAGLGIRPRQNMSIELVYHHYWLHVLANDLRNSPLTAIMNGVEARQSKDVGSELDLALGFRNIFGVRRLGMDVRAGVFLPGEAFRIKGDEAANATGRHADRGFTIFTKFWW
jgi:alginate production protein